VMKLQLKTQERFTKQLSALLTKEQYDFLLKIARTKEVSLGEVIRAIVDAACTSLLLEDAEGDE